MGWTPLKHQCNVPCGSAVQILASRKDYVDQKSHMFSILKPQNFLPRFQQLDVATSLGRLKDLIMAGKNVRL